IGHLAPDRIGANLRCRYPMRVVRATGMGVNLGLSTRWRLGSDLLGRYLVGVVRIRKVCHQTVPLCLGEMVPLGGTPPLEVAQVVVILGRGSYRYPPTWAFQRLYIAMVRIGVEARSEEHTSELQSRENLVCRLLLEKKKNS